MIIKILCDSLFRPLILAIQFMTRIPMPSINDVSERDIARSQYYYPVAGLVIGSILYAGALLSPFDQLLTATLLLSLWVGLSGALHLDGFADCIDAWVGGHGDREKMLRIMKDPQSGPMAVAGLICLLLIKLAAIHTVLMQAQAWVFAIIPLLSRSQLATLFRITPYLRQNGLGSALSLHHSDIWLILSVVVSFGIASLWSLQISAILLLTSLLIMLLIRQLAKTTLGGITGDVAGAQVELSELLLLLTFLSLSTPSLMP